MASQVLLPSLPIPLICSYAFKVLFRSHSFKVPFLSLTFKTIFLSHSFKVPFLSLSPSEAMRAIPGQRLPALRALQEAREFAETPGFQGLRALESLGPFRVEGRLGFRVV